MSIVKSFVCLLLLILPAAVFGQTVLMAAALDSAGDAAETTAPELQHFDPTLADKSLNPCDNFYKYSCNKWLTANPIPPDQVFWSTGSSLQLWNEMAVRETLEAASANDSKRSPVQQKIGDYWAACMDESGIEAAGLKPLQMELDRIAAIQSKKDIISEIAHLHHLFPGAWQPADNQSNTAFFGFTGQQDYDNASIVVAQIDQGG
ncbi:MAG: M13 family metallopeptidase N-terminal domain-containing protein, partial [Candidatus Sulfotelmatobacter sp.]